MKLINPVSRVNGRLFVIESPDGNLSYLIPIQYWNPFHLFALLQYLIRPRPDVVTIEEAETGDPLAQDRASNDDLSGEFKANS